MPASNLETVTTTKDTPQFHLILGSFNIWSTVEITNKETKEGQAEQRFV